MLLELEHGILLGWQRPLVYTEEDATVFHFNGECLEMACFNGRERRIDLAVGGSQRL